jgi:hypothetical protein
LTFGPFERGFGDGDFLGRGFRGFSSAKSSSMISSSDGMAGLLAGPERGFLELLLAAGFFRGLTETRGAPGFFVFGAHDEQRPLWLSGSPQSLHSGTGLSESSAPVPVSPT